MKIASIADVKAKFSEYIKESRKGAVIVTKNGKPTAALIYLDNDDDVERLLLSHSKVLHDYLSKSENQIKSGRGVKHKDFWKKIDSKE